MFINSKSNERANFKVKLLNDQRNFDNAVKDAKRQYWYTQQQHLLTINQKKEFWKKFGSVGISKKTQRKIPWEVQLEDGSISTNHNEVLTHWKSAYEQLLNVNRPISRVVIGREVGYRSRLIYVRYCLTNTTLCL